MFKIRKKLTVMCSDPDCTKWGYKTRGQIRARPRSKSAAKPKVRGGCQKISVRYRTPLVIGILLLGELQSSVNRWRMVNFIHISTKSCNVIGVFAIADQRAQESVVPILSDCDFI